MHIYSESIFQIHVVFKTGAAFPKVREACLACEWMVVSLHFYLSLQREGGDCWIWLCVDAAREICGVYCRVTDRSGWGIEWASQRGDAALVSAAGGHN